MQIIPTIELLNGRCVSLHRGRTEEPQIWHVDPIEKARGFAAAGAEWVHVTDLDAATGQGNNNELLQEIIRKAGLPVQLGGGFRSMDSINEWIEAGAGRVVLGTSAVTNPQMVREAAKFHPDQIVVSVDVFQDRVMTHGWKDASSYAPDEFVQSFDGVPLAAIIVSDIDADIGDAEDSLALITRLAGLAKAPVIARGLSRSLDDLSRMKYVPHVSGALVGRALFDRSIEIEDAMEIARPEREAKADFI